MTGPEHSRRAAELLDEAQQTAPSGTGDAASRYALKIAEAQVHATLALAAGGSRRPFWYGWLVLAFAVLCAGVAIFGYDRLANSYSADTAGASTGNLAALQAVTMSGSGVQWTQQARRRSASAAARQARPARPFPPPWAALVPSASR
jgi:hypothetical protein